MAHFISHWYNSYDPDTNRTIEKGCFNAVPFLKKYTPEHKLVMETCYYPSGIKERVTASPTRNSITAKDVTLAQNGEWYKQTTFIGAPSIRRWHENGNLIAEEWWYAGKRHRHDGPAWATWSDDGLPITELWYHSGKYHRFNAPATRHWYINGDLADEQYFIYGYDIYSAEVMILAEKMGITDMLNLTMAEANVLMLALKK